MTNAVSPLSHRARLRSYAALAWRRAVVLFPVLVEQFGRYGRLMRLNRPIGIWLLLWPTLWGLWLATSGNPSQHVFIVLVVGTIVTRSAGCIINDFADREIDRFVRRTAARPLATREVAVSEALILFAGLMLIALGLVLTLNQLSFSLAVTAAVIAVAYPFTKRFFAAPQAVLGIAFAWGVPMAFAAELASVPRLGWLVFLSAVIWGVVYDTEYAMVDRDDDVKLGVRSTAILFGEMDRALIGALQLSMFAALVLVGDSAALGRWYYVGLACAALVAVYQQILIKEREPARCLRAFQSNAWLGGAVFAGMLLDYLFRA